MFKFLKRQPHYVKRTGGGQWTRRSLMEAFAEDLKELDPVVHKNTITLQGGIPVTLYFLRKEYSKPETLAFSVSLSIAKPYLNDTPDGWLLNLEHFREAILGKVDEPIALYTDEDWQSSRLHQDVRKLYAPLLTALCNPSQCFEFLEGRGVAIGDQTITKAQIIATYGSAVPFDRALRYFKKTYTLGMPKQV